jgi:hypothetical protein
MTASRSRPLVLAAALLLAAGCGRERVTVRGSVHDAAGEGSGPWSVWAVEAEREAEVRDGRFELGELVPGPVTLELRQAGKAVGRLELATLPGGLALGLEDLRVDRESGRAFPAAVELEGADVVWINGVRMAGARRVPASVDAAGVVLAVADGGDALLFRPADEGIPDLRVVVTPVTQWVTRDGQPATPGAARAGDSLRVQGASERGYVVASRVVR